MEEEYERFEVNEFDLDSAFNPLKRRRFTTKHEQIYGMWAEKEDEDSEMAGGGQRSGFGSSRGKFAGQKDYSTPVNFVSGGVKEGDRVTKEVATDEENEDADDATSVEISSRKSKKDKKHKLKTFSTAGESFAGLRTKSSVHSKELRADWERYTKGIGSKLLEKMGHKHGTGLGREGQGIAEPIQAKLRPGRGAVGIYGPETKGPKIGAKPGEKGASGAKSEDEEEEAKGERKPHWRKGSEGQRSKLPKTPKVQYKTWDDLAGGDEKVAKGVRMESQSSVKIIDMTGREQRVYTGYEAFSQRERFEGEDEIYKSSKNRNFDVPELRHNLDLLVNMTEEAIIRNDRQLRFLKDQNVALKNEEKELEEKIAKEKREDESLAVLVNLLDEFSKKAKADLVTLEDCKLLIQTLQEKFYAEYKIYSLSDLAVTNVLPLFKEHLNGWDVLETPDFSYDLMTEWKLLIEQSGNWAPRGANLDDMDPFHRMLWEGWMPHLRRATLSWDTRECDKMINLLETWSPVLPAWILENVLEQLILPRLQTEVESWDPTTDTLPIHSWLHPWLPLMGDRLQPVYAPIRHKLSRALSHWDPRDPSAKKILKPWQEVFTPGTMDCFLVQNILPKLEVALAQFVVNPANQPLDVWHRVMDWADMLSPVHLCNALISHFFPKWLDALFQWLSCATVNYSEVSHWYTGWKSMFSPDLLAFPAITDQFNRGLELMNMALSGGPLIRPASNISYVQETCRQSTGIPELNAALTQSAAPATFKELLDQKAIEYNILFVPVPGKTIDGKPVYRFGENQIFIDRNVVFVNKNNKWQPVSVDELTRIP